MASWRRILKRPVALAALAAIALLAGCGGDDGGAVPPESDLQTCAETQAGFGDSASAAQWGGKVAGISCANAGAVIEGEFLRFFAEEALAPKPSPDPEEFEARAEAIGPSEAAVGGFTCAWESYDAALGGWPILCEGDGQTIAWEFTPLGTSDSEQSQLPGVDPRCNPAKNPDRDCGLTGLGTDAEQ